MKGLVTVSPDTDLSAKRAVRTPRLLGRDAELLEARHWLARAGAGEGGILLVRGEPGIGKSRLVEEVLGIADEAGMTLCAAEANPTDRTRPFGVCADALGVTTRSPVLGLADLARKINGHRGRQMRLEEVPVEVHGVVEDLLGVFASACATAPVLLALDNVHWLDNSSLLWLRAVAKVCRQYPALVLLTTRNSDRPEVEDADAGIRRTGAGVIDLGPLEFESVRALAHELTGGEPGPRLSQRLAQAEGNPLFVTELVAALLEQGRVTLTADGQARIPEPGQATSLPASILHRIALLPSESIQTLRAAAVCGRAFDADDVSLLMGRPGFEVAESLRTAQRAGMIETRAEHLWFCHELIHDALYADWPAPVRRGLHRQLGLALADSGAPWSRVAHHLSLGATEGDAVVLEWLHRIGLELAPFDPLGAVGLLERSAQLSPAGTSSTDTIRTDLSVCLAWAGRAGEGEQLAEAVVSESFDVAIRTRAAGWLATSLLLRGRVVDSRRICDRALGDVEGAPRDVLLLRVVGEAASIALGDRPGALERLRVLVGEATAVGDAAVRSSCLGGLALAEMNAGHLEAATGYAAESVRDAESARTPTAFMGNSHVVYAEILQDQDRMSEAAEVMSRLLAAGGAGRSVSTVAQVERQRARGNFAAGRWDEVMVDLDNSLAAYETGADLWPEAVALHALMSVHRGDLDAAQADLDRFDAAVAAGTPCFVLDHPVLARAFLLEAQGRDADAVAVLAGGWKIAEAAPLAMAMPTIGPPLARLAVQGGLVASLPDVVGALDRLAAANPAVARLRAAERWVAGLLVGDAGALLEAVDVQQRAARPLDLAMMKEDAAVVLARDGHHGEARRLLDEADSCYRQLGAEQRCSHARARLRPLGVQPGATGSRDRPKSGWEALTNAERRVVELVGQRFSNLEIAEQLFVSRRTVESHVSHAVAKLGCASRKDLAEEGRRHRDMGD